jgi:hypothetical protein
MTILFQKILASTPPVIFHTVSHSTWNLYQKGVFFSTKLITFVLILLTLGSMGQIKLIGKGDLRMTPSGDVTSRGTTSLSAGVSVSTIYRSFGSQVARWSVANIARWILPMGLCGILCSSLPEKKIQGIIGWGIDKRLF